MKSEHLYYIEIFNVYLDYIRKKYPEVDIDSILEYAGLTRYQLQDKGYWLTQDQADRFQEIIREKTGNQNIAREAGRMVAHVKPFETIRQFIYGFITPYFAFQMIESIAPKITRGGTLKTKRLGSNKVEVIAKPVEGVEEKPYQCQNRLGMLEALPKIFTGEFADIEHATCIHRGDDCCRYIISWDNSRWYYWNRIISYLSVIIIAICLNLFFFLPYMYWLSASITGFTLILSLVWQRERLEKQDLKKNIEKHGQTADLLLQETSRRYENAFLIQEIGSAISTILNINDLLETVMNSLEKRLDIDRAMIMLADEARGILTYSHGFGLNKEQEKILKEKVFSINNPDSREFIDNVFSKKTPIIIKDMKDIPESIAQQILSLTDVFEIGVFIAAPIVFEDQSLGVLIADTIHSKRTLNQSDVHIITGIAKQIAISIHNARSFQKLRISEDKYRLVVDHANEGIIIIRDCMCLFANPKALELLGYSEEELILSSLLNYLIPEQRDKAFDLYTMVMNRQEMKGNLYFRFIHKNGAIRWCEVNHVLISWQDSDAILIFISDITERKQAEEALEQMNAHLEEMVDKRTLELRKSNELLQQEINERERIDKEKKELEERLARSQKMEALGLLAGGVAHDLNNVLSGLVSYPELLLMDLCHDSPLRKPIQTIRDSGKKAAAVVQDLLTLARRGVTLTSVVNLNKDIVQDYLKSPEHEKIMSLNPNVHVETIFEEALLNIKGSPVHLKKTLMNLIINAMEAQVQRGKISISTYNTYIDKPIHGYDDVREGDYVVLKVEDDGIGIDQDDLKRIFEPFYTKKVMGRSGTGLGLAVVWGTVQDHNGYIDVKSNKGKGTVFELFFPVTREEVSQERSKIPVEEYWGNNETILIVDDILEQREIASTILTKLNYSVITVSSGEEALEYLYRNSVDLVLLDMIMDPGIDGLDTYRMIVNLHPGQKAIIASGFAENERVKEAQRIGAGQYIKKPYTIENLGLAIKKELLR